MSNKIFEEIKKLYLPLAIAFVLAAVLFSFTFKSIILSANKSKEITEKNIQNVRINQQKLNEAYEMMQKTNTPLDFQF